VWAEGAIDVQKANSRGEVDGSEGEEKKWQKTRTTKKITGTAGKKLEAKERIQVVSRKRAGRKWMRK